MTRDMLATLKARKPELLAVLRGDYLSAAAALVMKIADPDYRAELVYLFDERAAICQYDGGQARCDAERQAYIELARAVEGRGP
jgi:acyl-CoA hydrolase